LLPVNTKDKHLAQIGGIMQLTYGQVEDLLADLHDIPPTRQSALRARLKHFKRLGFPAGVNTGRGRAAEYGPSALLRLVLAFEMLQLGMTPERAIATLRVSHTILIQAAGYTGTYLLHDFDSEADRPEHFFFIFDPMALGGLTMYAGHSDDETVVEETWGRGWWCLKTDFDAVEEWPRREAIINVTSLFGYAARHLERVGISSKKLGSGLLDWALSAEWRHRYA
jgi:hypothetical protein